MANKKLTIEEAKDIIDDFIENSFFDVHGAVPQKEYIDLLVQLVVGLCTAWWSIKELFDYINNKNILRSSTNGSVTTS